LNPIDRTTTPHIIIYQTGSGYVFKLSDLINIINTALAHSPQFFVDSMNPRNPYTNLEFNAGMLYKIYWKIRQSNYRMPILFQLYYECEFDIQRFVFEHESIIRDYYIADFVKNTPANELVKHVQQMIKLMDKRKILRIHSHFPNQLLVDIMRPYLKLYMHNVYSISHTDKKFSSYYKLKHKLREFINYNPNFGRKLMVKPLYQIITNIPAPYSSSKYTESFNTRHIKYDNSDDFRMVFFYSNRDPDTTEDETPNETPNENEFPIVPPPLENTVTESGNEETVNRRENESDDSLAWSEDSDNESIIIMDVD
jgi:hypothetical protein